MNKIYKSVYNEVLGVWVVVSEIAKTGGKKSKSSKSILATLIAITSLSLGVGIASGQTPPDDKFKTDANGNFVKDDSNVLTNVADSIVIGRNQTIESINVSPIHDSIFIGKSNNFNYRDIPSVGLYNVLFFGNNNRGEGGHQIIIGNNNSIDKSDGSIVIGSSSSVTNGGVFSENQFKGGSIAFGIEAHVENEHSLAIGGGVWAKAKYSNAIGRWVEANGYRSNAFGFRVYNSGIDATALGHGIQLNGEQSTLLGTDSAVTSHHSHLHGSGSYLGSYNNLNEYLQEHAGYTHIFKIEDLKNKIDNLQLPEGMTFERFKGISTQYGSVFGHFNFSSGENVNTFGVDNITIGNKSGVYGFSNTLIGNKSHVLGSDNNVIGDESLIFGRSNTVEKLKPSDKGSALAIGSENHLEIKDSIAFGHSNSLYGTSENSTAIGDNNKIDLRYSIGIGVANRIIGSKDNKEGQTIALGFENLTDGENNISIGKSNITYSNNSINIGQDSNSQGNFSLVLGNLSKTFTDNSIAIGNGAEAKYHNKKGQLENSDKFGPIAIGFNSYSNGGTAVGGMDVFAKGLGSSVFGWKSIAVGSSTTLVGKSSTVAQQQASSFGDWNTVNSVGGSAVGWKNRVGSLKYGNAFFTEEQTDIAHRDSLTSPTSGGKFLHAFGSHNLVMSTSTNVDEGHSIALGSDNKVLAKDSIALGDANLINYDPKKSNLKLKDFGDRMTAIGSNNILEDNFSMTLGYGNSLSAFQTMILGIENFSYEGGVHSYIIGAHNKNYTNETFIIGESNRSKNFEWDEPDENGTDRPVETEGGRNVINGYGNDVSGLESVFIGSQNKASGFYYNIIGTLNTIRQPYLGSPFSENSILGNRNKLGSSHSVILGNQNEVGDVSRYNRDIEKVIAIGTSNVASKSESIAVGNMNSALAERSIAIGSEAKASGKYSIVMGFGSSETNRATKDENPIASGEKSIAMGYATRSTGNSAIAIGSMSIASYDNAVAVGSDTKAHGWNSSAYGNLANAYGESSLALGRNSKAFMAHAFAVGDWSRVSGRYSGAYGYNNQVSAPSSYTIGNSNNVETNSSVAIGTNIRLTPTANRTVALGRSINSSHANSVVLGNKSESKAAKAVTNATLHNITFEGFQAGNADYGVVSVGSSVGTEKYSSDIHIKRAQQTKDDVQTRLLGMKYATKLAEKLVAMKAEANAQNPGSGDSITEAQAKAALLKDGVIEPASIGALANADLEATLNVGPRQIVNVAAGEISKSSTDAINGSQLYSVADKLITTGIKFDGNNNAAQTIKIGETINIKGKSNLADDATDGGENISTKADASGILIRLKKDLTGLTSITLTGGNKLDATGLTIKDGPSVLKTGINAGSKKITNVADPVAGTDAVNLQTLDSKVSELTNGGIKYEGNNGGEKTLALGQKITVKGLADWNATDKGANISTDTSTAGQLLISLSKTLTGLISANFGDTTINSAGLTITGGPSVLKTGINAGSKPIINVTMNGTPADNDVVNVGYVTNKFDELKALGYKLKGDNNSLTAQYQIGSELPFVGGDNITTSSGTNGLTINLNKALTGMTSIVIENGPTLDSSGLVFPNNGPSFGPNGLTVGTVVINNDGINAGSKKITNVSDPVAPTDVANKKYVDNQANRPITFNANDGTKKVKLGEVLGIKGDDENTEKTKFSTSNIMTWMDGDILRIGLSNEFKLPTIKVQDPADPDKSAEIKPDSIVFNGVDGKDGQSITLTVTKNGPKDVKDKSVDRIKLGDVFIATMLDGFKYKGNFGPNSPIKVTLNNIVNIVGTGGFQEADWSNFDSGKNIMTKVEAEGTGVKYTVALKKSPEFENLTLTGTPADAGGASTVPAKLKIQDGAGNDKIVASTDAEGDSSIVLTGRDNNEIAILGADEKGNGELNLKDKAGKVLVTLGADDDGNGQIVAKGKDSLTSTTVKHDGLVIADKDGNSKLGSNKDGVAGVEDIANATDPANPPKKRRLTHTVGDKTEEIATLEDGLIFHDNTAGGKAAVKLNNAVKIAGADKNTDWTKFDGGENIMTKIEKTAEGETVIRVALNKDLKLTNGNFGGPGDDGKPGQDGKVDVNKGDGSSGVTIDPNEIVFRGLDGKPGANGQPGAKGDAGITMTLNGKPGVDGKDGITRVILTDGKGKEVDQGATLKDGFLFGANVGEDDTSNPVANRLNERVNIAGADKNTDWTKFDGGENIMTKVEQNPDTKETTITVALKKDLELGTITVGKPGKDGNLGQDGKITVVNKDGEQTIVIDGGSESKDLADPNKKGPSIALKDPEHGDGSKLTPDGLEITKTPDGSSTPSSSLISVNPNGEPGLEDDSSTTKPRITLKTGDGEAESIATLNDGLGFKGDTDDVVKTNLNKTIDIVGGEKDESKLTTTEDKNIGIVVDGDRDEKGKVTKPKNVTVRLAKNLKGLESAEFKPTDKDGKPTSQSITINGAGVTVQNGPKSAVFNEDGFKVGDKGPSMTNNGISAGDMVITNVAPGNKDTDAAQLGQVKNMISASRNELKGDIERRYEDASAGTASAMAVASLPQAYEPGQSIMGVAGSTHEGHSAMAVGFSTISNNGRWILKGNISGNGRGQVSAGLGAGIVWK
ncbi:ESPR-type extended signal peptide-containing protein [Taylorella equigenitalis]|uniref:ESPR-type extended signal peptide-containing protein n=1 Tax=Taylorella equigenitalis TaxID=29575 RepID=UPI00237CA2B5|nr:ESPR-type extended signal peptide-containing protein [Taylorella equigenitalis]WDU54780.1 YadA-like family protein [Taylorella equigenitalis]